MATKSNTYDLEMRHFGQLPHDKIITTTNQSYTVLASKAGFPQRSPLMHLEIDGSILAKAQQIIELANFPHEAWILNLIRATSDKNGINVETNMVNYGSLATLHGLVKIFPEATMLPILNQVAPTGARAVLVSTTNGVIYLGRRSNVFASGQIDTYPAGMAGERDGGIKGTLRKEALEEASFRIGVDGQARLVGLARGRYVSPNPGFNFFIETDWSIDKLKKNTNKEHDVVYAIELDPEVLKREITDKLVVPDLKRDCDSITEHGLSALLQTGRAFFGRKWYDNVVNVLQDKHPSKVRITENDSLFC